MVDRRFVTDLKRRRDNRLSAVREKIRLFYEDAKENKYSETANCIKKSIKLLENTSKHENVSLDSDSWNCDFLLINQENKNDFVEEVIENVREGMEIGIENNLKNIRNELSTRFLGEEIKKFSEDMQNKYKNAVNLLVRLEKIKQIDSLESDLHEISKDLISCIDYNDKIEAELGKVD